MKSEQVATLAIVGVLGAGVLGSYVPIINDQLSKANNYDHWLQIPKGTRQMFYMLQILAAVGFVTWLISYCTKKNGYRSGLFSYGAAVVPLIVTVLLASSIGWSIGTYLHVRQPSVGTAALTSGSLILTAVCSILLLAGELEAQKPTWFGVLGLMFFCLVTVLGDGVGWNARFLSNLQIDAALPAGKS